MASLTSGSEAKNKDYGPGGVSNRPFGGRFMNIVNSTGSTLFLPENSAAERAAMYSNIGSVSGVTVYKGKYSYNNVLHDPKGILGLPGGAPCWSPSTPSASYRTPAGCASGFTDAGVTNTRSVNPNTMTNYPAINHGNQSWEFYQDKPYGCTSPFVGNISVRRCQRT